MRTHSMSPAAAVRLIRRYVVLRNPLAAQGADFASFTFDDCITGILWDAYERSEGREPDRSPYTGSEERVPYTVTPQAPG